MYLCESHFTLLLFTPCFPISCLPATNMWTEPFACRHRIHSSRMQNSVPLCLYQSLYDSTTWKLAAVLCVMCRVHFAVARLERILQEKWMCSAVGAVNTQSLWSLFACRREVQLLSVYLPFSLNGAAERNSLTEWFTQTIVKVEGIERFV